MKRLEEKSRRLTKEYLKQDFFPYTQSNGKIIMVSEDRRDYYEPNY